MDSWRAWCLLLMVLPGVACAERLRLVADTWPPFTDLRLPGNGVAVELVATALERAGYASEYRELPWERAIRGLQQGEHDVLVNAWYSEERARFGHFSQPYLINRIRLVQRKGDAIHFAQLSDLYPHRIAVLRGYAYSQAFNADPKLSTIGVGSFESAARMVHRRRVNLALEDEYVARFQFAHNLGDIAEQLEFLPTPLSENGLHILIRRSHAGHAEIGASFDAAISAMRADGSYAAIMARHGL
ncbi:substrate-binding periplasmic protein [Phytopseudomonas dryadis]|uniref:Amino acid ABC transporter substrate-binding protein n=1 Tax=Phytopseudomonas dryadis TaxID=2487520 RepID=A0A4Q9QV75_9GAMM|nr:transporter substrate-binding domain-containing protein [Pseudomonas dryadis]TBU87645.1 amino acid ABC transporter substrate-binding protein [Pseudomonas dryadis]